MLEAESRRNSSVAVFSLPETVASPPFQAEVKMLCKDRFYVKLNPEETTVVSWKKLLKDAESSSLPYASMVPAGAHPALEARIAPEVRNFALHVDLFPSPPKRFNSVIEKIERLYKGDDSSDENEDLYDAPEGDKYDTSDSFIDDEELDEYFSVDTGEIKRTGFFINKGTLETLVEPAVSRVSIPKKRKKKDIMKLNGQTVHEDHQHKLLKPSIRMKAAARKLPLSTVHSSSSNSALTGLNSIGHQEDQRNSIISGESKSQAVGSEYGKLKEEMICESKDQHVDSKKYDHQKKLESYESAKKHLATPDRLSTAHQKKMESYESAKKHLATPDRLSTAAVGKISLGHKNDPCSPVNRDRAPLVELQMTNNSKDMCLSKVKAAHKGIKEDESRMAVRNQVRLFPSSVESSLSNAKEFSAIRCSRGTVLERAMHELEREVAELCPPSLDLQDFSQPGGKSRRLPRAVKQKLAKVARLAAKDGKISGDLFEHLIRILGHVMQVKTLKRNLKEMIEMGLSARQEKERRLQEIKQEVIEMICSRVSSLQAQDVASHECSDSIQAIPSLEGTECQYKWDNSIEDRICDLYEQYIEGMDEDKGPQIRKLYVELVELWPIGWMDNIGIKLAIQRAKERKKGLKNLDSCREEPRSKQQTAGKLNMEKKRRGESVSSILSHSISSFPNQTCSSDHVARRKLNFDDGKFSKSLGVRSDLDNIERRKCFEGAGRKLQRNFTGSASASASASAKKSYLANRSHIRKEGPHQISALGPSKRDYSANTSQTSNDGSLWMSDAHPSKRNYLANTSQMSVLSKRTYLADTSQMSNEGSLRSSAAAPTNRSCSANTSQISSEWSLPVSAAAPTNRSSSANTSRVSKVGSLRISAAAPANRSSSADTSQISNEESVRISAAASVKRCSLGNITHMSNQVSLQVSAAAPAKRSYSGNTSQISNEASLQILSVAPAKRSYSASTSQDSNQGSFWISLCSKEVQKAKA